MDDTKLLIMTIVYIQWSENKTNILYCNYCVIMDCSICFKHCQRIYAVAKSNDLENIKKHVIGKQQECCNSRMQQFQYDL